MNDMNVSDEQKIDSIPLHPSTPPLLSSNLSCSSLSVDHSSRSHPDIQNPNSKGKGFPIYPMQMELTDKEDFRNIHPKKRKRRKSNSKSDSKTKHKHHKKQLPTKKRKKIEKDEEVENNECSLESDTRTSSECTYGDTCNNNNEAHPNTVAIECAARLVSPCATHPHSSPELNVGTSFMELDQEELKPDPQDKHHQVLLEEEQNDDDLNDDLEEDVEDECSDGIGSRNIDAADELDLESNHHRNQEDIHTAASILFWMRKNPNHTQSYHHDVNCIHTCSNSPDMHPLVNLNFHSQMNPMFPYELPQQQQPMLTLAMPEDVQELNSLHCFVRKHLLKLFIFGGGSFSALLNKSKTGKDDLEANDLMSSEENENENIETVDTDPKKEATHKSKHSSRKKCKLRSEQSYSDNSSPPRVGLQCIFCAHLPKKQRSNMSTLHPRKLSELYRYVCTWQRVHFYACPHVPPSIRDTYWNLKQQDKSRGKTKYWVKSAALLGLKDCPSGKGILYDPNEKL